MQVVIEPTEQQLKTIVAPYLNKASQGGLGIVIGYAGPGFSNIYPGGNLLNQAQQPLALTNDTPFELGSPRRSRRRSIRC
jgi:hypothetical protein